jgi:glycosyltransferase involved in cell wall biosynthesis
VLERGVVELLFVGQRDWSHKGGDVAIEVFRELRARGLPTVLHLVGAEPPAPVDADGMVVHGYIDKLREPHRLPDLYRRCDVLLVPSRGEGFGIVFAEAAAHGLPSLARATMGVESAVRHGESGILLPASAGGVDFADVIVGWRADPGAYDALVVGARRFYETDVNWTTAVDRFIACVGEVLDRDRGSDA